jgi:predicted component of viral defense system (DUF524 family)
VARLYRRHDEAEPGRLHGAHVLDAETAWVVEGTADEIAAIRADLGFVCEPVGPGRALLRFGNWVGRVERAGPLGPLAVHTGKWSERDYDTLLEDISRVSAALPFAAGAPTALPYERDVLQSPEILYHAFVWLRHALLRPYATELRDAVADILRDPHRRLVRTTREVPVALAARVSARALDYAAAGRWSWEEAATGIPHDGRGLLPSRIAEDLARESVDTAENRFTKAFLEICAGVVEQVRRRLGTGDAAPARRIAGECAALAAILDGWRRAPLWRDVGQMTHFPASSSVLQRRSAYRAVLRHHLMLRLGSRVPLDPARVARLLETKDIAAMYELWAAFTVIDALTERLGPPREAVHVAPGPLGAAVHRGLIVRWADGTELAYNPTYTREGGFHGVSRSLPLRPDVAVWIPAAGLHLFDAKFRLEWAAGESSYKPGDLHKMHAYRDAIPAARSAWVLSPGEEEAAFFDEGALTAGVGACCVRPGGGGELLEEVMSRLFEREHATVVPRQWARPDLATATGYGWELPTGHSP